MTSLRVIELNDLASLEALRPAWRRLLARIEDDSPYLTPEFMLPWMRLVRDRYRLRVLAAWDGDHLVGLAPIVERCLARAGIRIVIRSFPVFGETPPFDVMIAGREGDVMRAFVAHWLTSGPWDVMELADVRAESRTTALLGEALEGTALRLTATRGKTTYFLAVQTGWPEFLASRSRDLRRNLRRGLQRCQQVGETRFLRFPGDDVTLAQTIDATLQVIDRSWKAPADDQARWHRFFQDLMTELAAGGLLSWRCLHVKGQPIACLLEVDYRKNLHPFHLAVDLGYQPLSPGFMILGDAVRDVHDRRYGRLDTGGSAEYLHRWADSSRSFDQLRVVNTSLFSRVKARVYQWEHQRRLRRAERDAEMRKRVKLNAHRADEAADE